MVCQDRFWNATHVSSSQQPNTLQISHNHPCAKTVSNQVSEWARMKCFEWLSLARIKNNISTSLEQHLSMKSHWASTPCWHMLISWTTMYRCYSLTKVSVFIHLTPTTQDLTNTCAAGLIIFSLANRPLLHHTKHRSTTGLYVEPSPFLTPHIHNSKPCYEPNIIKFFRWHRCGWQNDFQQLAYRAEVENLE